MDGEKFDTHEKFIDHSRKVHHKVVSKCHKCGKQFISEKERLHHVRDRCQGKE